MKKAPNPLRQTSSEDGHFLTGQLLIAMPSMGDNRFNKSVILICAHDEKGAMGLVLNSEMENIDFLDLMEQLNLDNNTLVEGQLEASNMPVMKGGPVEEARGFLLHSTDFKQSDTITVHNDYNVSGSVDALKYVLKGKGPQKMLFILGYSGWGPGQLDQEMQANTWLTIDPDPELVFQTDPDIMWERAINKIGIDPFMLSSVSGHA